MPEGPSIVILREQAAVFTGQTIERAQGSAKLDKTRLVGQSVRSFRSWGKHFLIELEDVSLRVHLLLFGSYRINQRKESPPRLSLGSPAVADRCIAATQIARAGGRRASLQLRVPAVQARRHAQGALARTRSGYLSALQHHVQQGQGAGTQQTQGVLLPTLPEALWRWRRRPCGKTGTGLRRTKIGGDKIATYRSGAHRCLI